MKDTLIEPGIGLRGTETFARLISALLNPMFVSTFVFWILISNTSGSARSRTIWLIVASIFSTALPLAYVLALRLRGDISGLLIPDRQQRTRPLLVGLGSYLMGVIALSAAGAPGLIVALMGCYASNTAMAVLINLRWKISLHAIGIWGPFVALCYGMGYRAFYLSPLPIGVAWARLRLRAHTPTQTLAGGGLGAVMTFIQLELWT